MDLAQTQFDEHLFKLSGTPVLWRNKADELRHAASILRIEIEKWFKEAHEYHEKVQAGEKNELILPPYVVSTYNMLLGFSIENLFKGLILQEDPTHLVDGRLSKKLQKHNLKYLAELAKFKLSDMEGIFCDVATEAMITSGRYPIALKAAGQKRLHHLCDKDIFEALFQKLRETIYWHLDDKQDD